MNSEKKVVEKVDLRGLMASLLYLQKEMKDSGLVSISNILKNTMYQIDAVYNTPSCEIKALDNEFFKLLDFAWQYSVADEGVKREFLKVIKDISKLCK